MHNLSEQEIRQMERELDMEETISESHLNKLENDAIIHQDTRSIRLINEIHRMKQQFNIHESNCRCCRNLFQAQYANATRCPACSENCYKPIFADDWNRGKNCPGKNTILSSHQRYAAEQGINQARQGNFVSGPDVESDLREFQ